MRKEQELTFENARVVRCKPLNICSAIRKNWRGCSTSPVQLSNLRYHRDKIVKSDAPGSTDVATYELEGVGHAVVRAANGAKEIELKLDAGVALTAGEEARMRADVDARVKFDWLLSEEDIAFYTGNVADALVGLNADAALRKLTELGLDEGNKKRQKQREAQFAKDEAARHRHQWRKDNADSYDSAESDDDS